MWVQFVGSTLVAAAAVVKTTWVNSSVYQLTSMPNRLWYCAGSSDLIIALPGPVIPDRNRFHSGAQFASASGGGMPATNSAIRIRAVAVSSRSLATVDAK